MCCSEKQFWIGTGIFAIIWGLSIQFPATYEATLELHDDHVSSSTVWFKLVDLAAWHEWQSVYTFKGVEDEQIKAGLQFSATVKETMLENRQSSFRLITVNHTDHSLCWVYEEVWPFLHATHCFNVTSLVPLSEAGGTDAASSGASAPSDTTRDTGDASDDEDAKNAEARDDNVHVKLPYGPYKVVNHEEITGLLWFIFKFRDLTSHTLEKWNRQLAASLA